MKRLLIIWGIVVLGLTFAACIESNPQPSPIGGGDDANLEPGTPTGDEGEGGGAREVDGKAIYVSASDEQGTVVVVGRPGAAADASQGYYEAEEGSAYGGAFQVRDDGSFVIALASYLSESIILNFEYEETEFITTLELTVPDRADADENSPWLFDSNSGFEEPASGYPGEDDGQGGWNYEEQPPVVTLLYLPNSGVAQIEGSSYAVTPQSLLIVSNLTQETSVTTQANNEGAFYVTIDATEFDLISIFATNPLNEDKATAPLFLTVE